LTRTETGHIQGGQIWEDALTILETSVNLISAQVREADHTPGIQENPHLFLAERLARGNDSNKIEIS
jgi:hypothetical protein